jgi:hypothetical protein
MALTSTAAAGSLPDRSEALVTTDRILLAGAAIQLAFLPPTVLAYLADDRLLNGISVWIKPLKFEFSMSLNLLTILVVLSAVAPAVRELRLVRWSALAVAAASTFEIAYIAVQAARGVGSHYNVGTPVEALGYTLMGVGAVVMVGGAFLIGLAILRSTLLPGREGFRLGAAAGLMLGAALTLLTASVLSAGFDGPGHWVGGVRTDAGGLPIVGWSTTGGDLRVPHFFATHLAQALPLLGFAADRLGARRPEVWIVAGGVAGTVVVALTFLQAIAGRPLLAWA